MQTKMRNIILKNKIHLIKKNMLLLKINLTK